MNSQLEILYNYNYKIIQFLFLSNYGKITVLKIFLWEYIKSKLDSNEHLL